MHVGSIYVDLNGQKGPNMWGKDLYRFDVVRKNGTGVYSVLPTGVQSDTTYSNSCAPGWGVGCAAIRLYNPDNMT